MHTVCCNSGGIISWIIGREVTIDSIVYNQLYSSKNSIAIIKTKKQTKINTATTVSKEEITGIQCTVDCPVN